MCAITGIVNWGESSNFMLDSVRKMNSILAHRGPDDSGIWVDEGVAIGHRRLSIIDTRKGQQPMLTVDQRYIITYNGAVYNFRELRKEIGGIFKTDCDTEVVLKAYEKWGVGCLEKLNGMFSFFIWDSKLKRGFAARDLVGMKPFLYSYINNEFRFASEAKALVSQSPKVNTEAILEYLVAPFFSGVETSPFEDIYILPPGHYIELSENTLQVKQWGNTFHLTPREGETSDLRNSLIESIKRTCIADQPVGTYLSGGLDSTLITSISQPETCYSVRFDKHQDFDQNRSAIVISDDLPFATYAATDLSIQHEIVTVTEDSLSNRLERIARQNDLLPAWEQEIAQDALAMAAVNKYKVILVGDAADETHYGYHFLLHSKTPAEVIKNLSWAPIQKCHLTHPVDHFNEKYKNQFQNLTSLIIKRWLPRLLHNGDIHAMAHGLETRVPFADIELLRLAECIDPKLGANKQVLRASCIGLLPEKIRIRKKSALPKAPYGGRIYQEIVKSKFLDVAESWLDMDIFSKSLAKVRLTEPEQALMFRLAALGYWVEHYHVSLP